MKTKSFLQKVTEYFFTKKGTLRKDKNVRSAHVGFIKLMKDPKKRMKPLEVYRKVPKEEPKKGDPRIRTMWSNRYGIKGYDVLHATQDALRKLEMNHSFERIPLNAISGKGRKRKMKAKKVHESAGVKLTKGSQNKLRTSMGGLVKRMGW